MDLANGGALLQRSAIRASEGMLWIQGISQDHWKCLVIVCSCSSAISFTFHGPGDRKNKFFMPGFVDHSVSCKSTVVYKILFLFHCFHFMPNHKIFKNKIKWKEETNVNNRKALSRKLPFIYNKSSVIQICLDQWKVWIAATRVSTFRFLEIGACVCMGALLF